MKSSINSVSDADVSMNHEIDGVMRGLARCREDGRSDACKTSKKANKQRGSGERAGLIMSGMLFFSHFEPSNESKMN